MNKFTVKFTMNVRQPLLLASSLSLLLALPAYAEEKKDTPSVFPPNDFSVEKSTAEQVENAAKTATIDTSTMSPPPSAVTQVGNPWSTGAVVKPEEKKYPPVMKNTMLPPSSMAMPTTRPVGNNPVGNNYVPPFAYQRPPTMFQQPNFQLPPMSGNFPPMTMPARNMGYQMPNTNFSNVSPFGNSFSPNSFFNNGTVPTPWSNVGGMNPWRNNNNSTLPPFLPNVNTGRKKSWGDIRHIWPDFYTDFTDEVWDKSINAPYDMGRMPGGWRAPSLSSPDPVTVGDAVTNQFPPMLEEMGNMMNFAN